MTLDTTGFGIGTTSPASKLDVAGSIRGNYNTNTTSFFGRTAIGYVGHNDWAGIAHLDQNSTTNYSLVQSSTGITLINAASTKYVGFRINNVDKMRLTTAGDFGIGTTSPQERLHVYKSGATARIEVESNTTFAFFKAQSSSRGYGIGVNTNTFAIYDYNAAAYRMGVDSIGNIGIGTIDPNTLLDVRGDASFNSDVDIDNNLKVSGTVRFEGLSESAQVKALYYNTTTGEVTYDNSGGVGGVLPGSDASFTSVDISENLNILGAINFYQSDSQIVASDASGILSRLDLIDSSMDNILFDISSRNVDISNRLLVEGRVDVSGDISLNSNVTIGGEISLNYVHLGGHIIPTANAQFDLGNAEYKIRHLFLSDNSLYMGPSNNNTEKKFLQKIQEM